MITASAPAKVILFGEHAVVYGQPAIAVPISSLRAEASVEPANELRIRAADLVSSAPPASSVDEALLQMAQLVLETLQIASANFTITIRSQIPVASGLGSGAAVSAAMGRALSTALGHPLDNATLNALVYEIEKIHHGTPSGIDNTVIVYEQPVYFIRNSPIETFAIRKPFTLLVADTGKSALTRVAVGDVRKLYEAQPTRIQPILDAIGTLTKRARQAVESGDAITLGSLMLENHQCLQQLTVSSPELDALVTAAVSAGALGAKLSGGGRGGNMIALVTPVTQSAVTHVLLQAGAAQVFATTVGG